jgi:hypothetical protein
MERTNNMKRFIEYIKDVKGWVSAYYPKGWLKDKQFRKIRIRNALYCTAQVGWKIYNILLRRVCD